MKIATNMIITIKIICYYNYTFPVLTETKEQIQ